MRELQAIGLTPDGQHLLLAASPDAAKPSHRIAVDARFEAVLRGHRVDDPTHAPALSVQAMQARLRSGATVEEVAAAAGLPVSRVERFAGPVLSEREEVLRKVFSSHQIARRGRSNVVLGRAVAIALENVANVRLETVAWTAYRKADGVWVAAVSVLARGRARRAEWSLDDLTHTVKPLDAWASSLGHVEPAPPPGLEKAPRAKRSPAKVAAKSTPAKQTATKASAKQSVPNKAASRGRVPAAKGLVAQKATKVLPSKTARTAKGARRSVS